MDHQILVIAGAVISGLLSMLVILIGWLGKRVMLRLDEVSVTIAQMSIDIHNQLNAQATRIALSEVRLESVTNRRSR